jgi:hypothetical protein
MLIRLKCKERSDETWEEQRTSKTKNIVTLMCYYRRQEEKEMITKIELSVVKQDRNTQNY